MPITIRHDIAGSVAGPIQYSIGQGMARERYEDLARKEAEAERAREFTLYRDKLQDEAYLRNLKAQNELAQKKEKYKNKKKKELSAYEDALRRKREAEENTPEAIAKKVLEAEQAKKLEDLKKGKLVLRPEAERKIRQIQEVAQKEGLTPQEVQQKIREIHGDLNNWIEKPEERVERAIPIVDENGKKIGFRVDKEIRLFADEEKEKAEAEAEVKEREEKRKREREKDIRKAQLDKLKTDYKDALEDENKIIIQKRKLSRKLVSLNGKFKNRRQLMLNEQKKLMRGNLSPQDRLIVENNIAVYQAEMAAVNVEIQKIENELERLDVEHQQINQRKEELSRELEGGDVQDVEKDETVVIKGKKYPKIVEREGKKYKLVKRNGVWGYEEIK